MSSSKIHPKILELITRTCKNENIEKFLREILKWEAEMADKSIPKFKKKYYKVLQEVCENEAFEDRT